VSTRDKGAEAIAILESRSFLVEFARGKSLLPELFPGRYDASTQAWKGGLLEKEGPPTEQEVAEAMRKIVSVKEDERPGLFHVSFRARDARNARDRNAILIMDVNERLRKRDVLEAERAIAYLQKQAESQTVAEIRAALFRLIEEQTKVLVLANVSPEYALRTLDPPSLPDKPVQPRRLLSVILGAVAGVLGVVVFILIRFTLRPLRTPVSETANLQPQA
jgi:LPS O-antigen subunit length determinant protein (WzzB/FepE family)